MREQKELASQFGAQSTQYGRIVGRSVAQVKVEINPMWHDTTASE